MENQPREQSYLDVAAQVYGIDVESRELFKTEGGDNPYSGYGPEATLGMWLEDERNVEVPSEHLTLSALRQRLDASAFRRN